MRFKAWVQNTILTIMVVAIVIACADYDVATSMWYAKVQYAALVVNMLGVLLLMKWGRFNKRRK